jgi:uncharacterized protein (DUF1684 family)
MKLELLDWKRQIAELYARVRAAPDPAAAWREWRDARDELFARHSESPLDPDARARFQVLEYFDYDPGVRVLATVGPAEPAAIENRLPVAVRAGERNVWRSEGPRA